MGPLLGWRAPRHRQPAGALASDDTPTGRGREGQARWVQWVTPSHRIGQSSTPDSGEQLSGVDLEPSSHGGSPAEERPDDRRGRGPANGDSVRSRRHRNRSCAQARIATPWQARTQGHREAHVAQGGVSGNARATCRKWRRAEVRLCERRPSRAAGTKGRPVAGPTRRGRPRQGQRGSCGRTGHFREPRPRRQLRTRP